MKKEKAKKVQTPEDRVEVVELDAELQAKADAVGEAFSKHIKKNLKEKTDEIPNL